MLLQHSNNNRVDREDSESLMHAVLAQLSEVSKRLDSLEEQIKSAPTIDLTAGEEDHRVWTAAAVSRPAFGEDGNNSGWLPRR